MLGNRQAKTNQPLKFLSYPIIFLLIFIFMLGVTTYALANENVVKVEANVLNVRLGPGLSHEIMTQVNEGRELEVIAEENEWYKIRLAGDEIGWVASWLVDNTEIMAATNKVGVIINTEANIRQEPSTEASILGKAGVGDELIVLYQESNWIQVRYLGKVAWVHSSLIDIQKDGALTSKANAQIQDETSETDLSEVFIKTNGTNIRSEPTIDSPVLKKARAQEVYSIVSEENNWFKIDIGNGEMGWIASWVVNLSSESLDTEKPQVTSLAEATIVIDAGHGGHDPGAVAETFNEKDITLSTALLLANKLKSLGTNVILTRDADKYITLNDRVYLGHLKKADAFISIHYDALETENLMSGTTSYYYSEQEEVLAQTINSELEKGLLPNNGVRKGNYFVLRENQQPSVLVELGYLNNDYDLTVVNTLSYQQNAANNIYQGLYNYFSQ
ncbi:N-acetylmuramoyl-L-alanine amidase [Lacticigenium naphthae]|uniref:N-acetylmuramoyl-L-alanine amidase n=1 Tax=Lacticigenium naphthae TaxID=515351 RepID=UPI000418BF5D|nr:N-acetylmuramoyl-L-alanine amidase [Lacticigenium naphthae]